MDILRNDLNILHKVRVPANSRLQKVFNLQLTFNELQKQNILLKDMKIGTITVNDIIIGHREKTLCLLWKIISNFGIHTKIPYEILLKEIFNIYPNYSDLNESENSSYIIHWIKALYLHFNITNENIQTIEDCNVKTIGVILCYYYSHMIKLIDLQNTNQFICNKIKEILKKLDFNVYFIPNQAVVYDTTTINLIISTLCYNIMMMKEYNFAAMKIQHLWRIKHKAFISKAYEKAIRIIKKLIHNKIQRKQYRMINEAAYLIQYKYRIHKLKMQYKKTDKAIIKIQSFIRMIYCKNLLQSQKQINYFLTQIKYKLQFISAIKSIQRHYRFNKYSETIIKIQSFMRMIISKKQYINIKQNIIKLQSIIRMKNEQYKYYCQLKSVYTIQSFVRMILKRMLYKKQKRAVFTIQKQFFEIIKAKNLLKTLKFNFLNKKQYENSLKIQSWYRMVKCMKYFNKLKGLTIICQSKIRMNQCKRLYIDMKRSATIIQHYYIIHLIRKQEREEKQYIHSITIIQSLIRRYLNRKYYKQTIYSIIKTQSFIRMKLQRRKYKLMVEQYHLEQQTKAAVKIQSLLRRLVQQSKYQNILFGIMRFQVLYKMYYQNLIINNAVIKIQSIFRMFVLRKQYIQNSEEYKRILFERYIIQIQKHFRGKQLRKNIKSNNKLNKIRKHLLLIEKDPLKQKKTLKNRTAEALSIILKEKQLSKIITACEELCIYIYLYYYLFIYRCNNTIINQML